MMLMPSQVKREDFVEWLREQKPNDVVGYVNGGARCPVAAYLADRFQIQTRHTYGCTFWYQPNTVYPAPVDFPGDTLPFVLPRWAREFRGLLSIMPDQQAVTAKSALRTLGLVDVLSGEGRLRGFRTRRSRMLAA